MKGLLKSLDHFSVGLFVSSLTHEEHFNIFWMLILCHMCYKDLLIPVILLWCLFDALKFLILMSNLGISFLIISAFCVRFNYLKVIKP